jgi:hypothetical protein
MYSQQYNIDTADSILLLLLLLLLSVLLTFAPGLTPLPLHVLQLSEWLIFTFSSPPKQAVLKSMSKS